jgi:hypothetical protein
MWWLLFFFGFLGVRYLEHRHLVDVTEIFTSLNREKMYRLIKLAFYILLFFLAIYRLVAASVHTLLDNEPAG